MSESTNQISTQHHVLITPDHLVAMLVGSDSVRLKGFGGVPAELPIWIPSVASFDPAGSANATEAVDRRLARFSRPALVVCAVLLSFMAFMVGRIPAIGLADGGAQAQWTAKSVTSSEVIVKIGAETISIPVGAMLPSGELLRSVDVQRQTYATDTQITAVKK